MNRTFKPDIQSIPVITEFVESQLEPMEISARTIMHLCLAVEEIAANIIYHGQLEPGCLIEINLCLDKPGEIVLTISDEGIAFNPLEVSTPDLSQPLMERKPGGLGLHFVQNIIDEVGYRRESNKNHVSLKHRV